MPKYPEINVKLVGEDGNAFSILGRVTRAMRKYGLNDEEIDKFRDEATNGDYDHLLITVVDWVETDSEDEEDDDFLEEWDDEWCDKEIEEQDDEKE